MNKDKLQALEEQEKKFIAARDILYDQIDYLKK